MPRHDKTTKYYENRTEEEIAEYKNQLEAKRIVDISIQYIEKFLKDTIMKMRLENFTDEEINDYIEYLFQEEEEYGEYSDEDYDDEYDSEGSMYSDN